MAIKLEILRIEKFPELFRKVRKISSEAKHWLKRIISYRPLERKREKIISERKNIGEGEENFWEREKGIRESERKLLQERDRNSTDQKTYEEGERKSLKKEKDNHLRKWETC